MPRARASLGCRVKSGWATTVLVVGPAREPRVADARVIALSDPAVPASRQPYHAVLGVRAGGGATGPGGATLEAYLRRVVERVTRRSIAALLREYRRAGHAVRGMALVVGSLGDPARIANDHIRAHALEGQLFRKALERAARARRLRCSAIVERDLYRRAAVLLGRSEDRLRRAVTELGRSHDGPWRTDQKAATVAAWLLLRSRGPH